jgi:hypothetical protein
MVGMCSGVVQFAATDTAMPSSHRYKSLERQAPMRFSDADALAACRGSAHVHMASARHAANGCMDICGSA